MNVEKLYQDYSIDYRTEGHKHCRPGWVNCECPWCVSNGGHAGYHLGYNITTDYFVCWRCGFHPVPQTIAKLLNVRLSEAFQTVKRYGLLISYKQVESPANRLQFALPGGVGTMESNHRKYLRDRNFDPDEIAEKWGVLGSGPISLLDNIDYRFRLIIPFEWDGVQVSFDSRDITGKHISKYMACPKNRELIPHKSILYGKKDEWGDTIICVEGPTDAWRFGSRYACATSGIKYTSQQVRCMAKLFRKVWICFDANESQALEQMRSLRGDLRFRGVIAELALLDEGDPGSMSQSAANKFVKQLI